ncbi:MAG: 3-hydroxyisobutyrate dehydrogenase [Blastococcus sp.]|nr:3-hydroxyisobutyrate dehydrogenase [Blastococcus sp.]
MTAIAFLGLGRMGRPMAANLVSAGHDVTVWNRSPEKAARFAAEHGARAAATPAEAAAETDVVITMLADDRALLDAWTGADGALTTVRPGTLAIDMATVSPGTIETLGRRLRERQVALVDAPVSGSVPAATTATLMIMAAGEPADVERARAVLSVLGDRIVVLGSSGAGSSMKLAVNAIVHSLNQAVSEALVLAERAGIERARAYDVFADSAVAAPFVRYKRDAYERPGEIPVGFRLDLAAKDLRLALALAAEVGADLPQTRANLAVLDDAVGAGYGTDDESAVAQHLRAALTREGRPAGSPASPRPHRQ